MKKKLLALSLIAALVVSMTACGGNGSGNDKAQKDGLSIVDSEWYGLDVFQLDSTASVQSLAAEALFQWDAETNTVVDNVCTDWQVSEDGKTATFNVPEGMKFSTGKQVEPEDVVASIEHGLKVSPYAEGYDNIQSMDVNGRQVTLHLSSFKSDMLYYLCSGFIVVIPKDELDSMNDKKLMWGCHPYGLYSLAENGYISGSEVKLVRNDGYKCANPLVENKGPAKFKTVSVHFNEEKFTATEELKNGTTDIIASLSTDDQRKDLEKSDSVVIKKTSYPNIDYFEMNTDSPVFSDINVRKALALSLDRESLAKAMNGIISPAYSIIYDSVQNFSPDAKDWFKTNLSNDPEKAKKLLDEAGWKDTNGDGIREKNGKDLAFTWYAWTNSTTIPEILAEQLKTVGFKMNIEAIDWNYVNQKIGDNKYDTGIEWLSWAEPILVLNNCYRDPNAPGNTEAYKSMVKDIASTIDTNERTKKIGDAQMHIFENVNLIPLYSEESFTAYNKNLKGMKILTDGVMLLNDITY
ncbi:ABC transporter substrate-binding protein [Aminipila luticellarii]|nr:ABC transporter substrate-binding protein [Aminipila luticellarii]